MARELHLDGGEISLLKTIGLSGTQIFGKHLLDKADDDILPAELIETLAGLIERGYVISSKVNVRTKEDVERSFFRVNPTYARDLRDSVNPSRSRDQGRARRQRRG